MQLHKSVEHAIDWVEHLFLTGEIDQDTRDASYYTLIEAKISLTYRTGDIPQCLTEWN
jgi:hypothetical protein